MKQLRYVEVSRRNPITRIRVGYGAGCGAGYICDDVCMIIKRAGQEKCHPVCNYPDNPCDCGCGKPKTLCDTFVAKICALEIDDNGYAVFQWPTDLMEQKEGWYEGHLMTGCSSCGVIPLRIGPRCNVIEVETEIFGPDNACAVGCEDSCSDGMCHPKYSGDDISGEIYVPDYEVR